MTIGWNLDRRVNMGMFGTRPILKIRFLFPFYTSSEFYKKAVFVLVGRGIWRGHELQADRLDCS